MQCVEGDVTVLKEVMNAALPTVTDGTTEWRRGDLPNCRGLKVFIIPSTDCGYRETVALFAECGFQRALSVEVADVAVFLGGEDVDPSLYKQKCLIKTRFNTTRDTIDEFYFHKCVKLKIPMFGICRGAQFLHVMNGGKLWQDVNNHAGRDHGIVDIEEDFTLVTTSLHHQMIQWSPTMELIAVTTDQVATRFEDQNVIINLSLNGAPETEIEVEAGAYTDTRCFFTQGHPEIGNPQYRSWTMFKLHDFLMDWNAFADDDDFLENQAKIEEEEDKRLAMEIYKQIG